MTAAVLTFPDLSPEIFSIDIGSFHFALRWYALAYIAGILIAWRMAVAAVKATRLWPGDTAPMTPRQIEDMLTWIILGVILGGRIGFVVFYEPAYYFTHPLDILKVWNGGMAFHGGLIGVIVAAWIYTRVHRIPQLQAADLIAYAVPPGLLLGRLANFVNGELWGRASDLPWAMVFPDPRSRYCEGFAEPCARHPSQLYEAGLEGILLGTLLILLVWRFGALKAPGRVCGIFFAGYGMARFIVEFFRQPDAQFVTPGNPLGLAWQVGGYGLTQGQALSLPMIAFGIWLALRARRKA
ncbi:Prolipoprotein diacylglyceryl transferase [Marinibacterium anthonyi]|nr:Prolipoprotein diacylglyceryl transferase [Marinibacterium anthonyi]